ncbi:MAG: hypothetical protein JO166_22990 [Deltaproteobacteria bacterium]|nr:hypothetical protein [Deltaproteobacteria bacterium]
MKRKRARTAGQLHAEQYDLRPKNDAAPEVVEIMGRAVEDVDVSTDSAQKVSGKQPAERPANDYGPPPS